MRLRTIPVLLLVGSLSGCALPRVPKDWQQRPAEAGDLQDSGPSRLQLLFCYGPLTSHCLVRIVGPDQELVMWDPGGIYGHNSPVVQRKADVIRGKVPDLEKYWSYRLTMRQRSQMMGVFEWQVPDAEAHALRVPLIEGHDPDDPQRAFKTDIPGLACGMALADYLMRYTGPRLQVPAPWIQPADTAAYLWKHHPPDRVIMFDRKAKATLVYEPPERTAGRSDP